MKIHKVFQKLFQPKQIKGVKNSTPLCPIVYDRSNITANEFKLYVHWLAENNINKTFLEPDKFISKSERKILEMKKLKSDKYRTFLKYLSENNINRTFFQF